MTEDIRTYQRLVAEQSREIERLRQRLGPRGLEVVIIDGYGHYTNAAVKTEIERMRSVLRRIYEQYDNQDMSHADFRVHAARLASPVISEPKSAALLSEKDSSISDLREALRELLASRDAMIAFLLKGERFEEEEWENRHRELGRRQFEAEEDARALLGWKT
jgi:hypothetical protein